MKTILIVEDDHETRVSLRSCLEEAGHQVVSASNGASASLLLDEMARPDVILLDVNMPIMNGSQFLEFLRAHPDHRGIPVIQITAALMPRLEGVAALMLKPVDLMNLLELIKRCGSPD